MFFFIQNEVADIKSGDRIRCEYCCRLVHHRNAIQRLWTAEYTANEL